MTFLEWLLNNGASIISIIVGTWLFGHFGKLVISRTIRAAIKPDNYATAREEKLREDTLIGITVGTMKVIIWILAILVIINSLGINLGTLLAGAGVVGIALGLGAQQMLQDFVSGLFIILENQYRVGDVIKFDNHSGKVTAITLRATVIRDIDGNVHHFPNGMIRHTINMTMEYSKINLDVGVSYASDIDKVAQVIDQVGSDLAEDDIWSVDIIDAPTFRRVTEFGDSSIKVKIMGKTKPARQWAVTGELRKRLKIAFDKNDIEIPFPQTVIHQSKSKK